MSKSKDLFDNQPYSFAEVVLPLPLPKPFTYKIPSNFAHSIQIGSRVIVQFGKKRVLTGIVLNIHSTPPEVYEAKEILDVLDETSSLNQIQQKLFQWIADYYMSTIGEVYNAALPSGLKLTSESMVQLNPTYQEDDEILSEKEALLVRALRDKNLSYQDLYKISGVKNVHLIIKSLLHRNAIIIYEELKEKYTPKLEKRIRLHSKYESKKSLESLFQSIEKNEKQTEVILKYLQEIPLIQDPKINKTGIDKNHLLKKGISASSLHTLIKKNILEEFDIIVSRFEQHSGNNATLPELSSAQQEAKKSILESFQKTSTVLLHGITGSGKTEIYIRLIHEALEGGTQALLLLPEIALTTQIVGRLQKVFGGKMGVYHSKFSDNERVEIWRGVLEGRYSFVVGVRSSVFLPFDNLGLIIVDEEHETSYKQYDPAPRYNARDTALMLGKLHHANILLGSATPSIESYYNTQTGKWSLVSLTERYGNSLLPKIILADIRKANKDKTIKNNFTNTLVDHIQYCLSHEKQSIIFQNRRGYSPFLICELCSYIPKCEQCSVSLTYHMYTGELRCHYCGYHEKVPASCEACGSTKMKTVGAGTEMIEDELTLFFPKANIARMDLDTSGKKNSYQQIIQDFETGKTNILVGTQMVSKGLDFDNVSLVGIFDADRMIYFPDFRSHERAFQMITQVSGRAGRRMDKGTVVIQTYDTEHYLFPLIIDNNYQGFYQKEIKERQTYHYPPFTRLIQITVKDKDKKKSNQFAKELSLSLSEKLGSSRIFGPHTPVIDKIRNYFLTEILFKFEREHINIPKVKQIISEQISVLQAHKSFKSCIIQIDVDPS